MSSNDPRRGSRRRQRRLQAEMERQLPAIASALARSVQTGATLLVAIGEVAEVADPPVTRDLLAVVTSVERGTLIDDALTKWQLRWNNNSLDLLVAACRFGYGEGGDLGGALEGVALALLDRLEVADETRALSTQARSSATVLACLPLFGAGLFTLLDPTVGRVLFATVPGWICLGIGVSLNVLGAWSLSAIARAVVR